MFVYCKDAFFVFTYRIYYRITAYSIYRIISTFRLFDHSFPVATIYIGRTSPFCLFYSMETSATLVPSPESGVGRTAVYGYTESTQKVHRKNRKIEKSKNRKISNLKFNQLRL